MMNGEHVLEMDCITKKFPGVVALNDVSIQLKRGEILSLCGENGAGKSTLMKVLSGEYPCDTYSGAIRLDGKPVSITSNKHAETLGIAMIYQEISVELDLSIAENILLGRIPKNRLGLLDIREMNRIAEEALRRINVEIDVTMSMRPLSASIKQLVCIARALVREPKILVLDEPTAALTEAETENLIAVIEQLRSKGISCIYISHKLDEVFRISDRIVVMRDARVISAYERAEFEPSRIIEDMIGRHIDKMYPDMTDRQIGEEVLRVEHMKVQHPSSYKNIIEDVGFSVRKGEVLGLAGLVGSGRTELMRVIYGADPMESGKIFVEGKQVRIRSCSDAIKNGIGYIPEDRKNQGVFLRNTIKWNTVINNIQGYSKGIFVDEKQEDAVAQDYKERFSIRTPSLEQKVGNLSGGNQQKVVIAKTLAANSNIIIFDEPTRGIDVSAKQEIYKLMNELVEAGKAIIMVSSDMPELLGMSDRIVVIAEGHKNGEVEKADFDQNYILDLASGGKVKGAV